LQGLSQLLFDDRFFTLVLMGKDGGLSFPVNQLTL
jgi:hypothetical protein